MKIIKSKYSAEQLKEYYRIMDSKVDKALFHKIHCIIKAITGAPYIGWIIFLTHGLLKDNLISCLYSLAFAILGAIIRYFEKKISCFLLDCYAKKERYFINILDITHFPEYMDNVMNCKKLLALMGTGKLSLLRKGDSLIILYTDKDGNEELYPLACTVTIIDENTLDFSCHDEEIDKILQSCNLL